MAAAKALNPTSNLFSLLADDASEPTAVVSAPKPKKEQAAPKKDAAAAPASSGPAAMTPAEKAKLREQNKPKAPAKPAQSQDRPRRNPDSPQVDERTAGPRGSGNRGARRAVNAEPHGHQAPNRGRAFDRQSAGKTTRNPPQKKGGAGKNNWGDDVKDSVVDQDTAAAVSGWGDGVAKPAVEDKKEENAEETTEAAAEEPAAPAEPEEVQLSLDDYLKQKEAAQQALLAKIGVVQPRKLDNVDLAGAVEPKRAEGAAAAQPAAKAGADGPASRKGTKAVDVAEVFKVRVAPIGGEDRPRGGGRGRGRGGRGGERGGDRAPRGDRPPRAEGDKPREPREPREPRAPRPEGAARGGRGGERGRGSGRGRALDTSNNRQFPSLGQ